MQVLLLQMKRRSSRELLICFIAFFFSFCADSAICAGSCRKLFNVLKVLLFVKEKVSLFCHKRESMRNIRERKLHRDSSAHVFILVPTKGQGDFSELNSFYHYAHTYWKAQILESIKV